MLRGVELLEPWAGHAAGKRMEVDVRRLVKLVEIGAGRSLDLEGVRGLSASARESLEAAGYGLAEVIRATPDDELLEVPEVGRKTVELLREAEREGVL